MIAENNNYPRPRPSLAPLEQLPNEVRWFIKFAEGDYAIAAAGLFADMLSQVEFCEVPEQRAHLAGLAASMWQVAHAPMARTNSGYLSFDAAVEVATRMWLILGRLVKYGHPFPCDVKPEELQKPDYIERRERWRSTYADVLGVNPEHLAIDDLTHLV